MAAKGVEKEPSRTALAAALYRAWANKEHHSNVRLGNDDLAHLFLPFLYKVFVRFGFLRHLLKRKDEKLTPGVYEFMLARTAFFDSIFANALGKKIPQIVLLGAGYDTRSIRFMQLNQATQIIELDIAPTQNQKKLWLEKAGIEVPECLSFASIDFNKDAMAGVLTNAGYKPDKKSLFMWEGVTYYLEPESINETLKFIKGSHPESQLAFDYVIPMSQENIDNAFGAKEFIATWQKHRQNEMFKFSIDEKSCETFFKERGFTLIEHLDSLAIERQYLTDETRGLIGRVNGLFRFVLASLA